MTGDTRQSETAAAVDTIAEENIPRPYHPDHWRPIAYRVIDIQGCYYCQPGHVRVARESTARGISLQARRRLEL